MFSAILSTIFVFYFILPLCLLTIKYFIFEFYGKYEEPENSVNISFKEWKKKYHLDRKNSQEKFNIIADPKWLDPSEEEICHKYKFTYKMHKRYYPKISGFKKLLLDTPKFLKLINVILVVSLFFTLMLIFVNHDLSRRVGEPIYYIFFDSSFPLEITIVSIWSVYFTLNLILYLIENHIKEDITIKYSKERFKELFDQYVEMLDDPHMEVAD